MVLRARSRLLAPLLAAGLALIAILTGARGVDGAAATYRVELFARSGLTVWDSQWYGGHWTFDYSVLFAPVGSIAGVPVMDVVCVAVAAFAFHRLAGEPAPRRLPGAGGVRVGAGQLPATALQRLGRGGRGVRAAGRDRAAVPG